MEFLKTYKQLVIFLTSKNLQSYGILKGESLVKDRGYLSRLQVIRSATLENPNRFTLINILHAIITKVSDIPYRLRIMSTSQINGYFDHTVFLGVALGKDENGYAKATASIITRDLTLILQIGPFIISRSMELSRNEISKFIDLIEKGIIEAGRTLKEVRLIAIFRSRRFKHDEADILLNKIEKIVINKLFKKFKQTLVLTLGVTSYFRLYDKGKYDLVWQIKTDRKHGILLYKFRKFKKALRLEYYTNRDVDLGLVLAIYEYTRRLDVMSPYPLSKKLPAPPLCFAKNVLKWWRYS